MGPSSTSIHFAHHAGFDSATALTSVNENRAGTSPRTHLIHRNDDGQSNMLQPSQSFPGHGAQPFDSSMFGSSFGLEAVLNGTRTDDPLQAALDWNMSHIPAQASSSSNGINSTSQAAPVDPDLLDQLNVLDWLGCLNNATDVQPESGSSLNSISADLVSDSLPTGNVSKTNNNGTHVHKPENGNQVSSFNWASIQSSCKS